MQENTTSPIISPIGPSLYAHLDPPADVVASVAAARAACNGWGLSKVGAETPLSFSSEAELCDQLTGRTHPVESSYLTGIGTGVVCTLLIIGAGIFIRDVYRGLRWYVSSRIARRSPAA